MNYDITLYQSENWFNSLKWQRQWIEKMAGWWVGAYGRPKSVLDFGAGDGWWCKAFHDMGGMTVCAIELFDEARAYIPPQVQFIQHDLRYSLDLGSRSDLVICLEVAEHLPKQCAEQLVATICNHAANRVLFSSAPPGQDGTGHINLQPPQYWRDMFGAYKLGFDAKRTGEVRHAFENIVNETFDFLPRNVQIFSRIE